MHTTMTIQAAATVCRRAWPGLAATSALSRLGLRGGRAFSGSSQPSAGMHQTPIVDLLWTQRAEAKRSPSVNLGGGKLAERVLTPKTPKECCTSVTYEFSHPDEEALVDSYRNPSGQLRPGRLMEDLDALAGTTAFKHCGADDSLHIVTASVDRIKYARRPSLKNDVVLSGRVTWVGNSSMEIRMRAHTSEREAPFMESLFTFVARDRATGKAAKINPLVVSGAEEEALFQLGAKRDAARKVARKQSKVSMVGSTLDEEGIQTAHELLAQANPLLTMPALAHPNEIFLSNTTLQNTFMTMPQQRNTAGRIFGGFLMRRAYELARSTAHLFGGRAPVFQELDEVTFSAPVSVGDMIHFEACVLYTSERMDPQGRATVHTEVRAYVLHPEKRQVTPSNTFNFTFGLSENLDGTGCAIQGEDIQLRQVLPATRQEAYRIVERYTADLRQVEEDQSVNK